MQFFKNRTVLGVMCIAAALLICFGITPLFNKSLANKAEIVRVVKQIKSGEKITADMVKTVEVGSFNLPENVARNPYAVIGKYAVADFVEGDYILTSKVEVEPAAENAYLYHLDGKKQAISISVKAFANGFSGKLKSGDIVSVIAPGYKKQGTTEILPELKYMEVIAVTASSGNDANTEAQEEGEEKELPGTVTLLAAPEQSKLLAELEAEGKIHLSLVYRGERENAEKLLDVLHDPTDGKKPRSYRKCAQKDYLKYVRCRKHTAKMTRKAISKQLNYLKRDLTAGEERNKVQDYQDECERVEVERKFSLGKRKCGKGLVTAKLEDTAAHVVALSILLLNLRKIQYAFLQFPDWLLGFLQPCEKLRVVQ